MTATRSDQETGANMTETQKRSRAGWSLLVVVLVALGIVAWGVYFLFLRPESTDDAYVMGDVVPVYAQVAGYVDHIEAEQGEYVEAGATVATLDKRDSQIAMQQKEAELRGKVDGFLSKRLDIEVLKTNVTAKQLEASNNRRIVNRRDALLGARVYSRESYEKDQTNFEVLQQEVKSNQLKLKRDMLLTTYGRMMENPDIMLALSGYKNALLTLVRTSVCTPVNGVVAKRYVKPGAYVSSTQKLFDVIPAHSLWVEANFRENQISHLQRGDVVRIVSDVYGKRSPFSGVITSIGAGAGSIFAIIPPQNATGNWTKVVQRVPVRIMLLEHDDQRPLPLGTSLTVTLTSDRLTGKALEDVDKTSLKGQDTGDLCYQNFDQQYSNHLKGILNLAE